MRWKKWSAPGTTITGRSCGRAQSSTAASGTVSSLSPWMTSVSCGTLGAGMRVIPMPTSTIRSGAARCASCACSAAPKENPASTNGFRAGVLQDGVEVLELAATLVVRALGRADAAEIRPPGGVAELDEGARERLHHLVVERAPVERMRMRDQRDSARRRFRLIHRAFDAACRARDEYAARARALIVLARIYIFSRSTTRPCRRCSSMISSISAWST